jgi:hypothetical protein
MTNKFDLKKYLTENKATQASKLREGLGENKLEEKPKTEESPKGAQMDEAKKEKLKAKIKEMIFAELDGSAVTDEDYDFVAEGPDDEDYEKASREVEFGVNPDREEFDLKDFFMDDEEEVSEIPGFEGTRDALDDFKIREAKKKKEDAPEEDVNLDLGAETPEGEENLDINFSGADAAPAGDFNIDTSAVDPNIKAVQDALTQAQAAAEKIQDEKLSQQIGNTITMFTRTHIANKEPIRENEDEEYAEGSNNRFFTGDIDGPSLNIGEVEDFLESRYIFDDWESLQDSPSTANKLSKQMSDMESAIKDYLKSDLSHLTADMTDDEIEDQMSEDLNSYLEY